MKTPTSYKVSYVENSIHPAMCAELAAKAGDVAGVVREVGHLLDMIEEMERLIR